MEGLILAQGERWRRALHMQVERERFLIYFGREGKGTVANEWVTRSNLPTGGGEPLETVANTA